MIWHDLAFLHWPVDGAILRPHLPPGLELDTFDGQAWLGIVPFRMTRVAPPGLFPLPWFSAFPELNVRTYVTAGGKPGVWFISLDASRRAAVEVARSHFHLEYLYARIDFEPKPDGWFDYRCTRRDRRAGPASFDASYRGTGRLANPVQPGSIEYFLTERYCFYAANRRRELFRCDVEHVLWPLESAEVEIRSNRMTESILGFSLGNAPPVLAHFSKSLDVRALPMKRIAVE